jgi:hypothetical protein
VDYRIHPFVNELYGCLEEYRAFLLQYEGRRFGYNMEFWRRNRTAQIDRK